MKIPITKIITGASLTGGTADAHGSASAPDSSLPLAAIPAGSRVFTEDGLCRGVRSEAGCLESVLSPEGAMASSAVVAGAGDI